MGRRLMLVVPVILLIAVVFAVWFLARDDDETETETYTVPSEAMAPTLEVGEEITVDLGAYEDSEPEVNDIIVFHPPLGADRGMECGVTRRPTQACPVPTADLSDQLFVKRVVAGPGDTLAIKDGHPVLNGELQDDEDFILPCRGAGCELPRSIAIPPGHYFTLGDNRGASADSRYWGPVPLKAIMGRVEE